MKVCPVERAFNKSRRSTSDFPPSSYKTNGKGVEKSSPSPPSSPRFPRNRGKNSHKFSFSIFPFLPLFFSLSFTFFFFFFLFTMLFSKPIFLFSRYRWSLALRFKRSKVILKLRTIKQTLAKLPKGKLFLASTFFTPC